LSQARSAKSLFTPVAASACAIGDGVEQAEIVARVRVNENPNGAGGGEPPRLVPARQSARQLLLPCHTACGVLRGSAGACAR